MPTREMPRKSEQSPFLNIATMLAVLSSQVCCIRNISLVFSSRPPWENNSKRTFSGLVALLGFIKAECFFQFTGSWRWGVGELGGVWQEVFPGLVAGSLKRFWKWFFQLSESLRHVTFDLVGATDFLRRCKEATHILLVFPLPLLDFRYLCLTPGVLDCT